jgi:DNA polymerase III gamma/tau subunit
MADVQAALYAAAELAGRYRGGGQQADNKKRKRADARPPAPNTGLRAEEEPEEANTTQRKKIKTEKNEHDDEGEDSKKQKGVKMWVRVAKVEKEEEEEEGEGDDDDDLWLPPLADQAHMDAVQKAVEKAEDKLERLGLAARLRRQLATIISAKHEIRYNTAVVPSLPVNVPTTGLLGAEPK